MSYKDPNKQKAYNTQYYEKHKEQRRAEARARTPEARNKVYKKYYNKLKTDLFYHYGNACICCRETEPMFLTVDHINNDGAQHRKTLGGTGSGGHLYSWLRQNNYPKGFQILCWNCNWAKGQGGCPHQNISKLSLTQSCV